MRTALLRNGSVSRSTCLYPISFATLDNLPDQHAANLFSPEFRAHIQDASFHSCLCQFFFSPILHFSGSSISCFISIKPYFSYNGLPDSVASSENSRNFPLSAFLYKHIQHFKSNSLPSVIRVRVHIHNICFISTWIMICRHDLKKADSACADYSISVIHKDMPYVYCR